MPSGSPLVHCRVPRGAAHFEEHHLTATGADEEAVFRTIADALKRSAVQPLTEKIWCRLASRPRLEALRRRVLAEEGLDAEALPALFVEGAPLEGGELAGVQVWGVSTASTLVTVEYDGARGRLWRAAGGSVLWLGGIEAEGASAAEQTHRMLQRAVEALGAHGFAFEHVARTWFHLRDILGWYGAFNDVRNAFYRGLRLPSDALGPALPASTGIEAQVGDGECALDLLAVDGLADVRFVRSSALQGPASAYGSAFSRAAVLDWGGGSTVLVSGTASIDSAGLTRHVDDPEAQSAATLMAVGALLEGEGAGLADIASAVLYCKTPEDYAAWRRVTRWLQVPAFPCVCVQGDVCRPELRVELEAVALAAPRNSGDGP